MKFHNKIEAIKALRNLKPIEPEVTTVRNEFTGITVITVTPSPWIGLKEGKDFVEACMNLAEQPTLIFKLMRVSKMGGQVKIQPELIGHYLHHSQALNVMNGIMALKGYNEVWEDDRDYEVTNIPVIL